MGAQSLPIIRPLSMSFSSCTSHYLLSKVLRTQQPAPAAAVGTGLSLTLTPLKTITAGGRGGEGGGVKIMASRASSVLKVSSSIEERDKDSREIGKTESISKNHETKRKDRNVQDVEQGEPDLKKSKSLDSVFPLSDIKEKYKDAKLLPKWKAFQTIIFLERDDGLHDSNKIAAFDFDGCLADTDVRRVGADAWKLMYPSIPDKLQSLYNDGYKLVIFTNESNIERWKNKRQVAVDSKIGRLNNFIMLVKVPIQVFIACGLSRGKVEDPYRKPKPGMWDIMEKHFNSGIPVDMDRSFYVGDAAGRKTDHSDADLKFAQAVGLKFYVPEEYFCA